MLTKDFQSVEMEILAGGTLRRVKVLLCVLHHSRGRHSSADLDADHERRALPKAAALLTAARTSCPAARGRLQQRSGHEVGRLHGPGAGVHGFNVH